MAFKILEVFEIEVFHHKDCQNKNLYKFTIIINKKLNFMALSKGTFS